MDREHIPLHLRLPIPQNHSVLYAETTPTTTDLLGATLAMYARMALTQ